MILPRNVYYVRMGKTIEEKHGYKEFFYLARLNLDHPKFLLRYQDKLAAGPSAYTN